MWAGWSGSYGYNGPGTWNYVMRLHSPPHLGVGEGFLDYDGSNPNAIKYPPAMSEAQLKAPSELLALGDSRVAQGPDLRDANKSVWAGDSALTCGSLGIPGWGATPPRHGRNYNFLFCDGRVASLNPFVLFDPTNTGPLWNVDHQPHPETW